MYYPILAQRVKYLKEDYEGVNTMCASFREFFKDELEAAIELRRKEAFEKGFAEGRAEYLINTALNAYKKGWQIVDIADFLEISEEQVEEILRNNGNTSRSSNKGSNVSKMSGFSKED